jgi:hypothetical protein
VNVESLELIAGTHIDTHKAVVAGKVVSWRPSKALWLAVNSLGNGLAGHTQSSQFCHSEKVRVLGRLVQSSKLALLENWGDRRLQVLRAGLLPLPP